MKKFIDFVCSVENKSSEIIYFGGSFNPWHQGHTQCLLMAPKNLSKIIIFDNNPQKSLQERSMEHAEQLPPHSFVYYLDGNTPNPTHAWLRKLKHQLPDYKHSLLMGYDSYQGLSQWVNYENVLEDVFKLYVVNRLNLKQQKLYPCEVEFLGGHPFEQLASSKVIEN